MQLTTTDIETIRELLKKLDGVQFTEVGAGEARKIDRPTSSRTARHSLNIATNTWNKKKKK